MSHQWFSQNFHLNCSWYITNVTILEQQVRYGWSNHFSFTSQSKNHKFAHIINLITSKSRGSIRMNKMAVMLKFERPTWWGRANSHLCTVQLSEEIPSILLYTFASQRQVFSDSSNILPTCFQFSISGQSAFSSCPQHFYIRTLTCHTLIVS